jgi:hypothetical protein
MMKSLLYGEIEPVEALTAWPGRIIYGFPELSRLFTPPDDRLIGIGQ